MQKLVFQMKMRVLITTFLSLAYLCPLASPDAQGDALYALKTSLNASSHQLTDWNVNHVNPCTWSRIICDGDNNVTSVVLSDMRLSGTLSPRIWILKALETLQLQGNGITGNIPREFGDLTSLTVLNLEDNHLSGEIPSSLGNLKNLAYLTLNENDLSGSVPESLSTLSNLMDIDLASNKLSGKVPEQLFKIPKYNFTGNHLDCGVKFPPRCDSENNGGSSKPRTSPMLGCITGLVLLTLLGLLIVFFLCKKACKACRDDEVYFDVAGEVDQKIEFGQLKRFSWREIQIATDDFDETNVLGRGGFGKVYKGVLVDGTKVAVKRLMSSAQNPTSGEAAFLREVELISFAVHRNILRLIGFCTTPNERLLVYPFMKNLSVASRLREIKPGEPVLDWAVRKRVATGTARGLEYLHEHCNPKIIHRDVKAANVLLDDGFEAVIGDFGLAKLVDVRRTSITTQVRGTMGHIAPEYLSTGRSSEKTDVFGYGIMLLELVSGQRAVDFFRLDDHDEVLLLDHVARLQRERKLETIVDPNLGDSFGDGEVEAVIQIALLCTQLSPEDRPAMSEVVRMLEGEGLVEKWEEWEHVEVVRSREYEMLQRRINWRDNDGDSTFLQVAVELSGGR